MVGSNTAFGTGTLALTTGTLLADAIGRDPGQQLRLQQLRHRANPVAGGHRGRVHPGRQQLQRYEQRQHREQHADLHGHWALDNIIPTNGVLAPTTLVVYNTTTFGGTVGGRALRGRAGQPLSFPDQHVRRRHRLNSSGIGLINSQMATYLISTVTG